MAAKPKLRANTSSQMDLGLPSDRELPEAFRYQPDVITRAMVESLLVAIRTLPFEEFQFHGYAGKRRTVSFGWDYDLKREALRPAAAMPSFLAPALQAAAALAAMPAEELQQALVTEYPANSGIGWHRDKGYSAPWSASHCWRPVVSG
jgi:alkylated DNA repair dioxygenase AlkB